MDLGLNGKVALVAAGARGSGLAIARRLATEGAKVIVTGRDDGIVASALETLRAQGAAAEGIVSDMVSPEGVARIREGCEDGFGMPDILVVNPPSPARTRGLLETPDEEFYETYDAYVMSLVRLGKAFLPAMSDKGWGRVVLLGSANMKSPNSIDPIVSQNIRVAGAMVMKTLTYEFSQHGITFNTLAIGAFHTDLAKVYLSEAPEGAYQTFAQKVPIRRWGEVSELADVAAFLCSEPAGYLNGEVIRIDGGQIECLF